MNNCYKYINGKVAVIEDNSQIKEYEYQDSIDELLKQENVVEEIETTINSLKKEKNHLEKNKFKLLEKLFPFSQGFTSLSLSIISTFVLTFISLICSTEFGPNVFTNLIRTLSTISCIAIIPTAILQLNKFKKRNKIKIANLEVQINEFEENLEFEQEKLNLLKKDKTNNNKNINNSTVTINNDEIHAIKSLSERIMLYSYYRTECNKIKKILETDILNGILSNSDIKELTKISDETDKVLTKKTNF